MHLSPPSLCRHERTSDVGTLVRVADSRSARSFFSDRTAETWYLEFARWPQPFDFALLCFPGGQLPRPGTVSDSMPNGALRVSARYGLGEVLMRAQGNSETRETPVVGSLAGLDSVAAVSVVLAGTLTETIITGVWIFSFSSHSVTGLRVQRRSRWNQVY